MGNFKLQRANITLSSKMNSENLYVDTAVATQRIENLEQHYKLVIQQMEDMSECLKKLITVGNVKGEYETLIKGWNKVLQKQIAYTKNKKSSMIRRFKSDVQDIAINTLTKDIREISSKINKIDKN